MSSKQAEPYDLWAFDNPRKISFLFLKSKKIVAKFTQFGSYSLQKYDHAFSFTM